MLSMEYLPSSARPWRTLLSWWMITARLDDCSAATRAHYSATTPDRITIFMATICQTCQTAQEVVEVVRRVVIHEVGHHFGIDDKRFEELGWG